MNDLFLEIMQRLVGMSHLKQQRASSDLDSLMLLANICHWAAVQKFGDLSKHYSSSPR
jgi:hypothetical protein